MTPTTSLPCAACSKRGAEVTVPRGSFVEHVMTDHVAAGDYGHSIDMTPEQREAADAKLREDLAPVRHDFTGDGATCGRPWCDQPRESQIHA